jgi:1-acyl-sn-glycerol-3-phosphate acyltransferase
MLLGVPALRLAYRWRFVGADNIPLNGPVIVASNHISPVDPFALGLAAVVRRRPVRYLTGAEFFDWPVAGFLLRRIRMVPIRRGAHDVTALDAAVRTLRDGEVLGIFPEGRLGDGLTLLPGRSGVARLAFTARVPVVPVAVWGTQRRWPRGGIQVQPPLRPRVAVAVGEPIHPVGDPQSQGDVRRLTDEVMAAIEGLVVTARSAS